MRLGRRWVRAWLGAVVVSAVLAGAPPDAVAFDPDAIGWRIRWVATRDDGVQRVRVRIVFQNGSTTERFDGDCRVKVWNAADAARRVFALGLRPRGSEEVRFKVVLGGRSPVRADVLACRPG